MQGVPIAVGEGPRRTLCREDIGPLLESLHTGPLQPSYATAKTKRKKAYKTQNHYIVRNDEVAVQAIQEILGKERLKR